MHGILLHRPARTFPDALPREEIVLVAPPPLQAAQKTSLSWLQYLVPVLGSMGSVMFYVFTPFGRNPLIFVGVILMVVLSVLSGVLMRGQQRKQLQQKQKSDREKYLRYLAQQNSRLESIAQRQRAASHRLYPELAALEQVVSQRTYVWERRPTDDDFLDVRVGVSAAPLCCPLRLNYDDNPLADHDPELEPQAQSIISKYEQIPDEPIVVPLRSTGALAITGDRDATRTLLRSMLCSLAVFHSPEDLRIMAYFPASAAPHWRWLKWLPHTRRIHQPKGLKKDAAEPLCLLAETAADFEQLLMDQVLPELERQRRITQATKNDLSAAAPLHQRFMIVLDGVTPESEVARLPVLETLYREGVGLGVTIVTLVDERQQEPSILQARIEISDIGLLNYEETKLGGQRIQAVHPDEADVAAGERIARGLAPLIVSEKGLQRDLSEDVPLLSLLNIPAAERVQPETSWQPRSRPDLLRVPIGVCSDGEPLFLDLKEAADGGLGVHGLIIGATGSGKSELLRTIVSSLAITHDPSTLSFIFADFKGGAAFADLARLPHAAGMISNLQSDLSLVDRMYAALFGEQERRQRMLREAGNLDNIKQYTNKRHSTQSLEPMPYLLIVIDEFAELLSSRPDFLDLFVAIGRVGRSLGMHLLLATQRLGEGRIQGLEGHLRYRICLRTFNAQESSQVIGTPDAFYLPSYPGVGYFKVDTDVYKLFKTALISSPYVPPEARNAPMLRARAFTDTGQLAPCLPRTLLGVTARHNDVASLYGDRLEKEMDVVIAKLAEADLRTPDKVHQVWLPPLSSTLTLDTVLDRSTTQRLDLAQWPIRLPYGQLCVPVALLDKPLTQSQEPLVLDFSGAGGHVVLVGAPQSGKSTFLRALINSFMATHTPRDVQIYCLDFGGGTLRAYEGAPHVGGVAGKSERDKVRRTINQMRTIVQEREFLFRERRIDSMATYRARRQTGELADVPFGDVFLIVDDLGQLMHDFEGIDADLAEIISSGLTYGIHVAVTASRWPDVRPKLRDNIGTRLELRLNDPIDSEMGKAAAQSLLGAPAGRGVLKGGLQFQTALPRLDGDGEASNMPLAQAVESFISRVNQAWSGPPAPPILMLPSQVRPEDVPAPGMDPHPGVPVGFEEFRLDPVYLDPMSGAPHFVILGDSECGKTNLIRVWMHGLSQRYSPQQVQMTLVDYRRTLLDLAEGPHLFAYACTPAMVKDALDRLRNELAGRTLSSSQLTIEELRNPRKWTGPHHFVFVDDYETIVTPSGNPIAPLVDYLLQARDVGLHLILARQVGGAARSAFEPVFQRLKEMGTPGIIMSGDPQEGALLGNQKATALPPGRGYLVRRNQPTTLVQTVCLAP
jgi:S-DNA-T family DNA segregation ATPase FtsK/SpoIIIE